MNLQQSPTKRLNHNGCLSLKFANRRDKTIMTDCYQLPPLRASRALYINPDNPSEATVYMVETSGGLIAGDQNHFNIDVKEGANVCLIPQSATKIYPSYNGMWSSQNIDVSIGQKASLAWKTEAVIPFQEAKFRGQTIVHMAQDATLLWGEILSPGRDKRGEKFQYHDVKTNFQVWMGEECLIYDSLLFSPDYVDLGQLGLLEDHLYVGSLWFVAPKLQHMDIRQLNEKLQRSAHVKVGAALLEGKAVNVRWLASDLVLLKQEMDNTWHEFSSFMS
ncbi:urease accessory protein UreD [Cytobacillus praedii]|uniref:Urease accessory protein UreD n=1 Tax=Cytobacillus praedii TaxID=1742358 RepID=A0A4R1AWC2_9BACI|nr:urease accessory protein UreD [Cytobacillus praedii]TCJ04686.1 urease accessory protein [Cytobacillus praedii]